MEQATKEALQQLSSSLEIVTTGNFSHLDGISLTEEEQRAAILHMKQVKYDRLQEEAKKRKREAYEHELTRHWDHKELLTFVLKRSVTDFGFSIDGSDGKSPFTIDEANEHAIKALCYYFTNNPLFEDMRPVPTEDNPNPPPYAWKLSKGLLMQGNVGLGKSILMALFSRNKRQCYDLLSCRRISGQFAELGHEVLHQYAECRSVPMGDTAVFYQRSIGICFDDLGTEETKKNYGNEVNVMAEILLNRYDNKHKFGFHNTHITTNLSTKEIESTYGTRFLSRCSEMFNQIVLRGEDRRRS